MKTDRRERSIFCVSLLIVGVSISGFAKGVAPPNVHYAETPKSILTPDEVKTRIGTLRFFDRFPEDDTVRKVYDHFDFLRAVRAFPDTMTKLLAVAWVAILSPTVAAPAEEHSGALPSWSDGATKSAILQFVSDVTDDRGAKYVPPDERIAVFDNDGTLWCEQPVVQIAFLLQRVKELAPGHPEWRSTQPFKAALERDYAYLEEDFHKGGKGLMELVAATHLGMTQEQFAEIGRNFFKSARHPKFRVPYTAIAYQPMVELLEYLRARGFRTYICSGGGVHFMRIISEEVYGIPPENVIGSHGLTVFESRNGKGVIVRKPGSVFVNDRAGKPVGIDLHIGRRPILAAGNVRSGGDLEMLLYSQSGSRPSLQIMINHDDPAREYAYAEKNNVSLNAAKKNGWLLVSMKNHWRRIFQHSQPQEPATGSGAPRRRGRALKHAESDDISGPSSSSELLPPRGVEPLSSD